MKLGKLNKSSLSLLLASTMVLTNVSPLTTVSAITETNSNQVIEEGKVSLGASLDAQQASLTQQLLGATNVTENNIIRVDGNMVNQYLNDGSNASTGVFSSAYIQPQAEGYGVRVQIVTPQNITLVSPTTYQNAAITAGAKNVLVRIATVTEVTGEGALAGVYALLESSGSTLNPQDIQVANKEIQIVDQIKNSTEITDYSTNQLMTDIKINVINQINQNTTITEQELNLIIINELQAYNIDTQVDNDLLTELMDFAQNFSQTEAARDEETIEQLQISVVGSNWPETLAVQEGSLTAEEALSVDRPDYTDASVYHPIIPALQNRVYDILEQEGDLHRVYSHTFVVETLLPQLSQAELEALNYIRTVVYQVVANSDTQRFEEASSLGVELPTYQAFLTSYLNQAAQIEQEPSFNEVIQRISVATGLAPEAFAVTEVSQDGRNVSVTFRETWTVDSEAVGTYIFNLDSLEVTDTATQEVLPMIYDFESNYGVFVENNAIEAPIPEEYTVPTVESLEEYEVPIIVDESSEETDESAESTSDESQTKSTETVSEDVPAEESASEEVPAEETVSEEVPAEETVSEEVPAEETLSEEMPAEETVSEELPVEESASEEVPVEETVSEEVPAEESVSEEAPTFETPDFTQEWQSILEQMPVESVISNEDILNNTWGDYSDSNVYHPVIQAMYQRFFENVQTQSDVQPIQSHTFVYELMTPDISQEERTALNQLRWLAYQYYSNTFDANRTPEFNTHDLNLRDEYLRRLATYDSAVTDPNTKEIAHLISRTTGFDMRAYATEYEINPENPNHYDFYFWDDDLIASEIPMFTYNFLGQYVGVRPMGLNDQGLPLETEPIQAFSFYDTYGVEVVDNYQAESTIEIPAALLESQEVEESAEMTESLEVQESVESTEESTETVE